MRTATFALAVLLSGCAASQPLTFDQRMQLMHAMQQNRYVLPPPTVATIPQYTPPPSQPYQPIGGNPGQQAVTAPMPTPTPPVGYSMADCKITPMGTWICRNH